MRGEIDAIDLLHTLIDSGRSALPRAQPLSADADARRKASQEDDELIQVIDKDVRRTCPDVAFFQTWSTYVACLSRRPVIENCQDLRFRCLIVPFESMVWAAV